MINITQEDLKKFTLSILLAAGVVESIAEITSDHLVYADMSGHNSHGVVRLIQYVDRIKKGKLKPNLEPKIVTEFPGTVLVDGQNGMGQYTAFQSTKFVISKAREVGIACASIYNCQHIGMLGYYSRMIASESMIGILATNGGAVVAPIGSIKPMLGTNPLSIALPRANGNPIVLDMATSSITYGELIVKKTLGETVRPGLIIDANGQPTSSPAVFFGPPSGSIIPFGGYKGYALSLIVDLLSGGLSGAGFGEEVISKGAMNGVFMCAVDVSKFVEPREFEIKVDQFITKIKDTPRAEGFEEITVCGEPEDRKLHASKTEGIEIDDAVWNDLLSLAKDFSINFSGNIAR